MQWDTAHHALGVADMDATHREFASYVSALSAAPEVEFPALFEQLRAHTRRHFEGEYRLMQACRFAATAEHEAEHARVLADLSHLSIRVQQGNCTMARAYVNALPDWFAQHLATLDSALAARLKAAALASA
ncbi:hemerythrin family protein [Nitrogeniibacter mangrovi]|uniref:Hemerythrin family protein n=1 Tax=Nitrogeniibacter mangrovi TaxID=2016596 RepID=A0A6C1B826_9RHOO|nr:hemerythrin family protein [Nitrogeniibacter mangrovi]QID19523.1 hemerythrin family protein [Nitrogeniibacter mangrovi]